MEGSVFSFLKAEWKVSDTGSSHWAFYLEETKCEIFRGSSIDASYQVSVHLAKRVSEENIKMWKDKTTDDGRQVMAKVRL
jgi:hypothetical protein